MVSSLVDKLGALILTASGGICGSMILDERFEDLLKQLFGKTEYENMPSKTKEMAMKYWQDHVKPSFVGELADDEFSDVDYVVPIPGARDNPKIDLEGGFLLLTKYIIRLQNVD
jgi:hypothetical protein